MRSQQLLVSYFVTLSIASLGSPYLDMYEKQVVNPEALRPSKACLIAIRKLDRQSQTKVAKQRKLASYALRSSIIDLQESLRVDLETQYPDIYSAVNIFLPASRKLSSIHLTKKLLFLV